MKYIQIERKKELFYMTLLIISLLSVNAKHFTKSKGGIVGIVQ